MHVSNIFATIHATQSCEKYEKASVKSMPMITIKTAYETDRLRFSQNAQPKAVFEVVSCFRGEGGELERKDVAKI
jgi:hypothetical protein